MNHVFVDEPQVAGDAVEEAVTLPSWDVCGKDGGDGGEEYLVNKIDP